MGLASKSKGNLKDVEIADIRSIRNSHYLWGWVGYPRDNLSPRDEIQTCNSCGSLDSREIAVVLCQQNLLQFCLLQLCRNLPCLPTLVSRKAVHKEASQHRHFTTKYLNKEDWEKLVGVVDHHVPQELNAGKAAGSRDPSARKAVCAAGARNWGR